MALHLVDALRGFSVRCDLVEMRRLHRRLLDNPGFRAFHEGRSNRLPEYYRWRFRERLGRFADLLSAEDLVPQLEPGEIMSVWAPRKRSPER